jgi:hypothetical protein
MITTIMLIEIPLVINERSYTYDDLPTAPVRK